LDADPGSGIFLTLDPGWKNSNPRSGINITDPQHIKICQFQGIRIWIRFAYSDPGQESQIYLEIHANFLPEGWIKGKPFQIFFFFGGGGFLIFFSYRYYIQQCFICHPSDSTVPTDAVIEPRTVATGALAVSS
jgi:hypothetical protein